MYTVFVGPPGGDPPPRGALSRIHLALRGAPALRSAKRRVGEEG